MAPQTQARAETPCAFRRGPNEDAWPGVRRRAGLISFEPHKIAVHRGGTWLQPEPGQTVIRHGIGRDLTTGEAAPGRQP